jgi:putative ABC transport system ATP-binding protein
VTAPDPGANPDSAKLELQQVVKHYAGGEEVVRAVDGVDLTVAPAEFVALYGPSGSGKTTLLLLAAGVIGPDAGTVLFGGRDLATMTGAETADYQRRDIGFVYQTFHLMSGVPAVENAAIKLLAGGVPLGEARRTAIPWLERVGLGTRLDHVPERLSTGERQRVAIARALIGAPRLILADEPTGNLDTRRGGEILTLLADICREQNVGVLLVTHDPQAAAIADRVHTLRDGMLVEEVATTASEPPDWSSPAFGG